MAAKKSPAAESAAKKPTTKKTGKPRKPAVPRILTETQLQSVVDAVPEDRRLLAQNISKELSFMSKMMAALKTKALEIGPLEDFVQGSQCLLRENPALKSYNATIKNYAVMLSKLADLLPKASVAPAEVAADEFDDFVAGRDTD